MNINYEINKWLKIKVAQQSANPPANNTNPAYNTVVYVVNDGYGLVNAADVPNINSTKMVSVNVNFDNQIVSTFNINNRIRNIYVIQGATIADKNMCMILSREPWLRINDEFLKFTGVNANGNYIIAADRDNQTRSIPVAGISRLVHPITKREYLNSQNVEYSDNSALVNNILAQLNIGLSPTLVSNAIAKIGNTVSADARLQMQQILSSSGKLVPGETSLHGTVPVIFNINGKPVPFRYTSDQLVVTNSVQIPGPTPPRAGLSAAPPPVNSRPGITLAAFLQLPGVIPLLQQEQKNLNATQPGMIQRGIDTAKRYLNIGGGRKYADTEINKWLK